ncbi:Periplasmic serine protease [Ignavibacterium album JCM 16511]|uniref:Periplasmic serine protease n=1 Tax=Ignavibacterium album (strain DSM 19864 / JCM 16511 / NBRC 101810 / Mat9-16) TaxID=945713 RepID=I0ANY5_IGNAJ|nr:signal peptide peptidase SppA [Ignavibacterium album]AFH50692.1 Periplasmic serine protease [Ignavibacterium album JCM 16511]
MKKIFLLILFAAVPILSQINFPSYYHQNDMSLAPAGALKFGLYGWDNPAILSTLHQPDFLFTWNDRIGDWNDFNNWGIFTAIPNFGFTMYNQSFDKYHITDFKLSAGFGNNSFSAGFGYGWSTGDVTYFNRADLFTLGLLFRPNKFFSIGLVGNLPTNGEREGIIDAAYRIFGNELITLFGDYVFSRDMDPEETNYSFGAAAEPLDGLRLVGRYFEDKRINVGIELSFGSFGLMTISHLDKNGKQFYNTHGIRAGAYDRNIFRKFSSDNKIVEMNLNGGLKYQTFRFFDNSNSLIDLIDKIETSKNDKSVSAIAINLSGAIINREMLWEVREKLKEFKSSGKRVYIYIDRAGMDEYHFASVADKIILDPMGTIALNGYLIGRTFLKGSLDKIGIGFHELKYFKYKSAAETYSRESFSEADREQRQRLVDEYYDVARKDICEGRKFTTSKFDKLVDSLIAYLPEEALKLNLADTLGRWSEISKIIESYEGKSKTLINSASLEKYNLPLDNYWSEKQKIAIIYAIGGTSMDDGIKARSLSRQVESAFSDNNVKAIVLRVDSPGGDALAADLIAEMLRKNKGKKPIIVSQGFVAASGGYWLSMYADTIVAAPTTITGSIGVIGSFFYNKNLKENLGLSTDFVKRGKFADLGFGFTLPIIPVSLPDRDFTEEESQIVETRIKTLYKDFVNRVSAGRKKSFEEIEKIAQGRVWSGRDGLKIGLVDVIGGLNEAIEIARIKSGLDKNEYELREYPPKPFININQFLPDLLPIKFESNSPIMEDLMLRLKYNGEPMLMMPLDDLDLISNWTY